MIAKEGGLSEAVCEDIYWGKQRIRGHALPETLISHSGRMEAGRLSFIRSVRIAVHPRLRRLGLATKLIQRFMHATNLMHRYRIRSHFRLAYVSS